MGARDCAREKSEMPFLRGDQKKPLKDRSLVFFVFCFGGARV
jgi:hypothetical protein